MDLVITIISKQIVGRIVFTGTDLLGHKIQESIQSSMVIR